MESDKVLAMTTREAILATIRRKEADMIPFIIRWRYLPAGQVEHEVRNQGLGLDYMLPCATRSMPHVKMAISGGSVFGMWGGGATVARVTYKTPVGMVWSPFHIRAFAGAMQDLHDYEGIASYLEGRFVRKRKDWDVLKYVAEDVKYTPFYDHFDSFKRLLGDEGVVFGAIGPHSPYPSLLIDWAGATRLYVDHAKYRDKVEGVLEALDKSHEKQYPIGANAPADIVNYGDHIDDNLISPRIFERYILPAHNKFVRIAHAADKITSIHCDGRLDGLKHLISELEHDIIHAITPPPVGNLPIKEALDLWKDKVLWINYEYHFMGPAALKKHLLDLLRSIVPGYRVIMDASTERWVPPDCLRMFANIMSKATLPLTQEKIDRIEESV